MASTTFSKAARLITEDIPFPGGVTYRAVKDFAYFIDTHRDQPHVGMFHDDIHRGTCRPTLVHLVPPESGTTTEWSDWTLVRASDGLTLPLNSKHKFISAAWWQTWLYDYVVEHGEVPTDDRGFMLTTKLRDARAGVYKMKSFRQMVVEREREDRKKR